MMVQGYPEGRVGFRWPPLNSWVKKLLIYYGVLFGIQLFLHLVKSGLVESLLGVFQLEPAQFWDAPYLHFYRFATCIFFPDFRDVLPYIFHLLIIYFLGGLLQDHIGSKGFITVFLFSGIFAALGLAVVFSGSSVPLLGPGTSCLGLLACAAFLYPRMEVIFFFFPLPLWIVATLVAILYVVPLVTSGSAVAWAYLLGLGGGVLFAWNLSATIPFRQRIWPKKTIEKMRKSRAHRRKKEEVDIRREMDRILEKISRKGIGSLTPAEKGFLDKASRRLRKPS